MELVTFVIFASKVNQIKSSRHNMATQSALQEITRRLQEERDALRTQVEELTKKLVAERSAKVAVDHDLQAKEVELLQEQLRTRQTKQSLLDRIAQLEKELEDTKSIHQALVHERNVIVEENSTLNLERQMLQTKYKKEIAKCETLRTELEQLQQDTSLLSIDREQIIQRTESDARRVRELWDQINREHETKTAALSEELEVARQEKSELDAALAEAYAKTDELEALVSQLEVGKAALELQIASLTVESTTALTKLEELQNKERSAGEEMSKLLLQIHSWQNKCMLLEERLKISEKEKDMSILASKQSQKELEARSEELLALKTEFGNLLDKYESSVEIFKQKTRERDVHTRLQYRALDHKRRYAEELVQLRRQEIKEFKQVVRSVNRRLNEVREMQEGMKNTSCIKTVQVAPKSVSIYRH